MSLQNLTTAQLQTMQTNLFNAHATAILAESGSGDGVSYKGASSEKILEQLSVIGDELATRGQADGDLIVVEFDEPL